jgi:hypothetical protein
VARERHKFMFADGQMQNGHADAAGKRWRPQAAKQRGKLAQRAVIVVTGVLLFVLGAKVRASACMLDHNMMVASSMWHNIGGTCDFSLCRTAARPQCRQGTQQRTCLGDGVHGHVKSPSDWRRTGQFDHMCSRP